MAVSFTNNAPSYPMAQQPIIVIKQSDLKPQKPMSTGAYAATTFAKDSIINTGLFVAVSYAAKGIQMLGKKSAQIIKEPFLKILKRDAKWAVACAAVFTAYKAYMYNKAYK